MSKSVKLKNNTYLDSMSVNYKRNNLEQFLINRFTLDDINIGKLTDFNQQYGYKQVSIEVPANSIMIVCGLHTGQVSGSSGLQMTNIYNGLYRNDTDEIATVVYYLNYHRNVITENKSDVYLQVLFVNIK
ncbi:MAG: hypothetical protein ACI4VL_06760 [Bacilli bacterium]